MKAGTTFLEKFIARKDNPIDRALPRILPITQVKRPENPEA